jgi:hypothetical protein
MQSIHQFFRDFPILEVPAVLGIILGINFVTFRFFGPWRQLASSYGNRSNFVGQKWHFEWVWFNYWGSFSTVTFGVNNTGLYMAPWFVFRGGHPPIVIPWEELQIEKKWWWFSIVYNLRTKAHPQMRIYIDDGLFKKLSDNSSHVRDRQNFPT